MQLMAALCKCATKCRLTCLPFRLLNIIKCISGEEAPEVVKLINMLPENVGISATLNY